MPQHRAWPRLGLQESVLDGCMFNQADFRGARDESGALMDDKQSCSLDWSHSQQVEWLQPRAVRTGRSEQLGVL